MLVHTVKPADTYKNYFRLEGVRSTVNMMEITMDLVHLRTTNTHR